MKGNNLNIYSYCLCALLVLPFGGCVGTVEDANPSVTKGSTTTQAPLIFNGIYEAVSIADEKVDVFFYPASGDNTDLTYQIYYDGLETPISVPATTLTKDYRGLLKYTVTGLSINTNYSFKVQVKNLEGNSSESTNTATVQTFSNVTCDFAGISNVRNLSGEDGRTALRVEWPAARKEGSDFVSKNLDPEQYEITLLNTESLTPEAFDDDYFGEPDRKVVYVDGDKIYHQVNGLQEGTEYFVRVRCIHYEYLSNGADSSYKKEENSDYYVAETLSDDLSSIDVDLSTFQVSVASFNSINASWEAAEGSFQEYRIYYHNLDDDALAWASFKTSKSDVCSGEDSINDNWFCKKVDYDKTSTVIADLDSLANYEMYLVICLSSDCSNSESLVYETDSPYYIYPGVATFAGITNIENPRNYWAIDEIYLTIATPDYSTGILDGLIVEMKARSAGPTADTQLNNPDGGNTTDYQVAEFDYTTDTEITITGIDATSSEQYCFSVLPYIYNNGEVEIDRDAESISCLIPAIELPTIDEYEGIDSGSVVANTVTNSLTVSWSAPSGGVYDSYIVFIKEVSDGSSFSFTDAVAGSSEYTAVEVPYGTLSKTLSFLPDGIYRVGVLAYYSAENKYSDFNNNIYLFDTGD